MNFDYCIYHRSCVDGISSAWIVKKYFPSIHIIECGAGEIIEEIDLFYQKNIIFVDVCPPKNNLDEISKLAKHILIIDHHITTYENVTDKDNINITLIFDEKKSGCQLTWEYFCQNEPIPWFLNYIADRDLWKLTMPYSKEINIVLYEEKHTRSIENLDILYQLSFDEEKLELFKKDLIKKGKILVENRNALIISSSRSALPCMYKNYRVWLYTCPKHIVSDVGAKLTKWKFKDNSYPDFVVFWNYDVEEHLFMISLRSAKNATDVHLIASELSEQGGGHRNASGCKLPGGTELRTIFVPIEEDNE